MNDLRDKKSEFTRSLIVNAAIDIVRSGDQEELSFKRVSAEAGLSERTMFRYFPNRDSFLNQLTVAMHALLEVPELPDHSAELPGYAERLYKQFDKHFELTQKLLAPEFLPRILETSARERFDRLQAILQAERPRAKPELIMHTTANLRYVMSATSWRYYRIHYGFDLATSVNCAQLLVRQALAALE